ncbi:hypothetical protein V6N13_102725 [Hibiscus sabdariffa]|uniref:Epidermal patterning factor-like protein n=1 Tax=Hibiscus sabdariffa TaxID=183260 RepID=A0ABR2D4X6_9ROSI
MERTKKIVDVVTFTLLLAVLSFSVSVHSRELAGSPSPSPESLGLIAAIRRPGSFPASCHSKCKQCEPCMPVEVSIRAAELEENEYYPQVWQCMCRENIYPP